MSVCNGCGLGDGDIGTMGEVFLCGFCRELIELGRAVKDLEGGFELHKSETARRWCCQRPGYVCPPWKDSILEALKGAKK